MSEKLEELFDKHFAPIQEIAHDKKVYNDCLKLYVCGQFKEALLKLIDNNLINEFFWRDVNDVADDQSANSEQISKLYLNLIFKLNDIDAIENKDDQEKVRVWREKLFTTENLNNIVSTWNDPQAKLQFLAVLIASLKENANKQEQIIFIQDFIKDELFKGKVTDESEKNDNEEKELEKEENETKIIEYKYQLINLYIFNLEIEQLHENIKESLYYELISKFDRPNTDGTNINNLQRHLQTHNILNYSMEDTILYKLGKPKVMIENPESSEAELNDFLKEEENNGSEDMIGNSINGTVETQENINQNDNESTNSLITNWQKRFQSLVKFIVTRLMILDVNPQTYQLLSLCFLSIFCMSFRSPKMRQIMRKSFQLLKKSLPTILQILQVLASI